MKGLAFREEQRLSNNKRAKSRSQQEPVHKHEVY